MKISKETVEHVANLSRLYLSEEEMEGLTGDLQDILSYVDKLSELDTDGVEPTQHVLDIKNVFRKDEKNKSYERDKILSNSPKVEDGCIKVPKIVE